MTTITYTVDCSDMGYNEEEFSTEEGVRVAFDQYMRRTRVEGPMLEFSVWRYPTGDDIEGKSDDESIHTISTPFTADSLMREVTKDRYESESEESDSESERGRLLVFKLLDLGRDEIAWAMANKLCCMDLHIYTYNNFPHDRATEDMVSSMDELNRTGETGFKFRCSQDRDIVTVTW